MPYLEAYTENVLLAIISKDEKKAQQMLTKSIAKIRAL
jgi:hypothetical protein